jgi:hypothetical protein
MPVILLSSSALSARGHTHLLSHHYGINGDAPGKQDSPTTLLYCQFKKHPQTSQSSKKVPWFPPARTLEKSIRPLSGWVLAVQKRVWGYLEQKEQQVHPHQS